MMNIATIFDKVAEKMRSDFEESRSAVADPGIRGEARAAALRRFLQQYLPNSLEISTGHLVDAGGNSSRQLDVIISDDTRGPTFFASEGVRVIPVECAYAVVEVKSNLDTRELKRCYKNMESVRSLRKDAFVLSGGIYYAPFLYGNSWPIWPINYFVFSYESMRLETVAEKMNEVHNTRRLPLESRIDTICVLDRGVVCNKGRDGKLDALPGPGSELNICKTDRALLLFYALISRYFNRAYLPCFEFPDYLRNVDF